MLVFQLQQRVKLQHAEVYTVEKRRRFSYKRRNLERRTDGYSETVGREQRMQRVLSKLR